MRWSSLFAMLLLQDTALECECDSGCTGALQRLKFPGMNVSRRSSRVRPSLLAACLLGGCSDAPIVWDAPDFTRRDAAFATAAFSDETICSAVAGAHGPLRFRAGWSRTGGGLLVTKSADSGDSWERSVVADDRPQEAAPCDRPPPALFVDSANNFVHVTYFAEVSGGAGVYYVHSMNAERMAETGEGMFEQPVALTYGTRPVRTAVASRGDTVIAVYEDPNSPRGGLLLAMSATAGHSFAWRVPVSGAAATDPSVELRSGGLTVSWREPGGSGRVVRRSGTFR